MPIVLIILIVSVVFLYSISTTTKPINYPPGPRWFPFMGCSRAVAKACKRQGSQHRAFAELAKEYSTSVLGLKMGKEMVVVVFGEKLVRHVFTSENFEGRPRNYFMKLRCLGKQIGITGTDGALWREHRQFTVKHLKDLGFGKQQMESEIINELEHILDMLKKQPKAFNLREVLAPAIMNVLWKFAAGECIREDARLQKLLSLLNSRSKAFNMSGGWLNEYPWIRFLAPESSGYSLIRKINKELMAIISEAMQKHEEGAVKGEDFMYAFFRQLRAGKATYTREQLSIVCLDLLIAGSQTTSNSLEFAFLMILRNPKIQERIFGEISTNIGVRTICWDDHERLPYTMSFLLEVQRYFSLVPLAGPRRTSKNCSLGDYSIPKNTTILIALHDLHHSPDTWHVPQDFNPERFLDGNGGLKHVQKLVNFGLGRRRCPGDSLAKRCIFLIFVGVLQKYKIECSNGVMPSSTPVYGILAAPEHYTADFRLRC